MEIIRDGTPLGCECGGASRGMRDRLPPRTEEAGKLDELATVTRRTRLACQILGSDGLEVTLPRAAWPPASQVNTFTHPPPSPMRPPRGRLDVLLSPRSSFSMR